MITLSAPDVTVTVDPEHGGRIAGCRVRGRELLVGPDRTVALEDQPMTWGSFPMAPWAGRVRRGAFRFDGATFELDVNLAPHAIHGTTFTRPWRVADASDTRVELAIDLGWPLGGVARQSVSLEGAALHCELAVTAGDRGMPAELGWHPWFVKPAELGFHPSAMYRRDADGIPDGTLVEPTAPPWDDCFVNTEPVVVRYEGFEVEVTSDCDHWVVYTEPTHATCVEPQSGPPDAFTIRPRVLAPGEALTRWMRWTWS